MKTYILQSTNYQGMIALRSTSKKKAIDAAQSAGYPVVKSSVQLSACDLDYVQYAKRLYNA